MKPILTLRLLACGFVLLGVASASALHSRHSEPMLPRVTGMDAQEARGTFEVVLQPLPGDEGWGEFSRMSLDKSFQGDLSGTSKGVMLAAQTAVKGSAGYVALERVSAELAGRKGTFVLQHSGVMGRGKQALEVRVVPDSGTGELEGLEGTMELAIEGGEHSYVFSYSFAEAE